MKKNFNFSFKKIICALNKGKIIAYPTESVFALGCDPDNEQAIYNLLLTKKRSWKKGLILIAGNYRQIIPYINEKKITKKQKNKIIKKKKKPITWVIPVKKNTSKLITGTFKSIAVRITQFKLTKILCLLYNKPIISTSANISGFPPCKLTHEVISRFKKKIFVLNSFVGKEKKTSEIKDIITNYLYRKG